MTVSTSDQENVVFKDLRTKWESEQMELKGKVIYKDTEPWQQDLRLLRYVGGVDVSFVKNSETLACASLVVCGFPDLQVVYSDCGLVTLDTPYIPGFLAFREVGFFMSLLDKLRIANPDLMTQVILVDGNGILHPRGFGIASHLGVLSGIPCVGVAKTLMQVDGIVKDKEYAAKIIELSHGGDSFPLTTTSGTTLGMALRGCDKSTKPIFVSIGHRVSLETAVQLALRCCLYRVTEPVRQADIRSREFLRESFPDLFTQNQQPKTRTRKKADSNCDWAHDRAGDRAGDRVRDRARDRAGDRAGDRVREPHDTNRAAGSDTNLAESSDDEELGFECLFGSL